MRILIAGSEEWSQDCNDVVIEEVSRVFKESNENPEDIILVYRSPIGADKVAVDYALSQHWDTERIFTTLSNSRKDQNERSAQDHIDLCLAFLVGGDEDTFDLVERVEEKHIPVQKFYC